MLATIQKNAVDPTAWDLISPTGEVLVNGESFAVVDGIRESLSRGARGNSELDEVAAAILATNASKTWAVA